MRVTRLSGSEGGGILCDSPYPYSDSTEKRLAHTLLLLARYGKQDQPQRVLPKVSQEMLAENHRHFAFPR
ncbi:MAG: hypothetical protein DMG32_07865, partial [Acidobacteria bacterium]